MFQSFCPRQQKGFPLHPLTHHSSRLTGFIFMLFAAEEVFAAKDDGSAPAEEASAAKDGGSAPAEEASAAKDGGSAPAEEASAAKDSGSAPAEEVYTAKDGFSIQTANIVCI